MTCTCAGPDAGYPWHERGCPAGDEPAAYCCTGITEHTADCWFWLDELGGREQLAYQAQQRRSEERRTA